MKPTQQLHDLGQSLWLDNTTRDLLTSGTIEAEIHPDPAGQNRAADAIFKLVTNQRKHRFRAEVKA
jgi:hypothetical protein